MVSYSLLNTGAIAIVLSLTTRARIAAVKRENFAWVWVTHAWSHAEVRLTEGPSGWVAAHGQLLMNANPVLDLQGPVANRDVHLASAVVVPFMTSGSARGALAFYAEAPEAFTLADSRVAVAAANQLSCLLGLLARSGEAASIMQPA